MGRDKLLCSDSLNKGYTLPSAVIWDVSLDHEADMAGHHTGILLELLTACLFSSVVYCPQVRRN